MDVGERDRVTEILKYVWLAYCQTKGYTGPVAQIAPQGPGRVCNVPHPDPGFGGHSEPSYEA